MELDIIYQNPCNVWYLFAEQTYARKSWFSLLPTKEVSNCTGSLPFTRTFSAQRVERHSKHRYINQLGFQPATLNCFCSESSLVGSSVTSPLHAAHFLDRVCWKVFLAVRSIWAVLTPAFLRSKLYYLFMASRSDYSFTFFYQQCSSLFVVASFSSHISQECMFAWRERNQQLDSSFCLRSEMEDV